MDSEFAPTLQNLVDQKSLKWIFVGGKGGVGKTTTSSSLAVEMSKHRENVLIISTDPAHNLSDAFDQKFSGEPSKVKGFENLFAMEIDPNAQGEGGMFGNMMGGGGSSAMEGMTEEMQEQSKGFLSEIMGSIPGIDEATSFGQILKSLDQYNFDVIIFDTAPTGHTLRLLNFPKILEKGIIKLIELKEKFGGMLSSMGGMMGQGGPQGDPEAIHKKLFESMDSMKKKIEDINNQFKDPAKTTFVAVCIPEFLSMYETERLAIELAKQEIDIRNIVVNQVLFPDPRESCKKCVARRKMQDKYLTQIKEIYDDFHITVNPQLDQEVRGI